MKEKNNRDVSGRHAQHTPLLSAAALVVTCAKTWCTHDSLYPHRILMPSNQTMQSRRSRNQPCNTDETPFKCLTCWFCVYKMSHISSSLKFHSKPVIHHRWQLTGRHEPHLPLPNPANSCNTRSLAACLFIKTSPKSVALPFITGNVQRQSGVHILALLGQPSPAQKHICTDFQPKSALKSRINFLRVAKYTSAAHASPGR